MYLTYARYKELGGELDETAFNDFEFEAECLVNYYTFNRLKNETEYPEELEKVMYSLIKTASNKQQALGNKTNNDGTINALVSSQSNDGVSVSWNVMSASEVYETLKNDSVNIIRLGLDGVRNSLGHRLLYRGIYPDE